MAARSVSTAWFFLKSPTNRLAPLGFNTPHDQIMTLSFCQFLPIFSQKKIYIFHELTTGAKAGGGRALEAKASRPRPEPVAMAGDAPQLAVKVIRGRDLTLVDGRPCDPCVCVAVEKQRYTTQVRTGAAAAPEWNESFLFSVPAGTKDLVLTVSDWSGGERERALGTATIQLSDRLLTLNRPHHAWVPLQAASADTSSLNSDGSIAAASSERDGARGAVMIEVSVYSPYYLHVSCACPWCARGFIYRFNRFSVGNQIEYKGPASATPANARHANGETASAPAHVDAMADNVLAPPASAQRADGETASSHHHEPVDAMADNAPAPPASERHEDGETASSPHHEPVDATADTTPAPPDSERHEDGETASLPHHEPVDAMADNTPAPPASARHADGETASADAEGAADAADGGLRAEGVADSESPEDAGSGDEDVVTEEELEVLRKEAEEARQELERVREESAAEAAAEEAAAVEAAAAAAEAAEAAAAAEAEAAEAAGEVLEACLAPALAKEALRGEARVAARAMLAVILSPALRQEAQDIAAARAKAQAEADAAAAAAKAAAEAAARQRRVDPPPDLYPEGVRPPDSVPTRELGALGASSMRPDEVERVAHQAALRANRSLAWGAPRQALPDEAVYGPAAASPVESLIAAEQAWLKSCHVQMDSGLADRLASNRADFAPRLPEIPLRRGAAPAGCAVGSARPYLAAALHPARAVDAQAQNIRAKEAEVQRLEKRQDVLQSSLPFIQQQIHAGARVMGRYDQGERELREVKRLLQKKRGQLLVLRSSNPVIAAPAVVALGRDRAEQMAAKFSLPHQIERHTRALARTQEEASMLAWSLRAKDIIVRSGKAFEIETERDAWAQAHCLRPQSALREMSRLSVVQVNATALRVCQHSKKKNRNLL